MKKKGRERGEKNHGFWPRFMFGFMLEIKGMRATISSSLSLKTVGLKTKKNLEISRFKGRS